MCFLWIGSKRKSHDVPCALIRLCNHMGKPERHLWFQEHWNILSNVLFRQAAAKKKCRCSGNLWIVGVVNQRKAKGPRNWCRLFIRHKHFSRLGKLFHTGSNNTTLVTSPNNGNRPTWATGIVITIHKSKWVSFFESTMYVTVLWKVY